MKTNLISTLSFGKQMNIKAKRINDDLDWELSNGVVTLVQQLMSQKETAGLDYTLQSQLFHGDLRFHVNAFDTLIKAIETCPASTVNNLDLILQWRMLLRIHATAEYITFQYASNTATIF